MLYGHCQTDTLRTESVLTAKTGRDGIHRIPATSTEQYLFTDNHEDRQGDGECLDAVLP